MEIFNVLAAAAASFFFGALWYMVLSGPLDGRVWRGARGRWQAVECFKPTALYSECGLGSSGRRDDAPCARGQWGDLHLWGAIAGFGIGAFLIVPWMMMNNEFAGKPFQLTVIDGGYAVIGCTLMGTVLMAF